MRARVLAAVAILVLGACRSGAPAPDEPSIFAVGEGPSLATANTMRLAGGDELRDAVAITQAIYPATLPGENVPGAIILAPLGDLAIQLTAVQITHMPVNAPVLFADASGIPEVIQTEIRRLAPEGVAQDNNVQVYVVGELDAAAETAREMGYRVRTFAEDDPVVLAEQIDRWKSTLHGDYVEEVVVANVDRPEMLAGIASFYAHASVHLAWVRNGSVPDATRDLLSRRGGHAYLYLAGDETVIDQATAGELSEFGNVQRMNASDPVGMSVVNADFGDLDREFSWDIGEPGHNFTFVPDDLPPAAVTATALSHLGKHGPMLVIPGDSVPSEVRTYLQELQPAYLAADQGLFNHGWIVGGADGITLEVQGEIDQLLAQKREG